MSKKKINKKKQQQKNPKISHCVPQVKTQYLLVDTKYSLVMKCNVLPLQIK